MAVLGLLLQFFRESLVLQAVTTFVVLLAVSNAPVFPILLLYMTDLFPVSIL